MITKSAVFVSYVAAAALVASQGMAGSRHGSRTATGFHETMGAAHVARSYSRSGHTWRSASHWRHHRFHGGSSFVFYGGFPYYGYYPYSYSYGYPYWGSYPYAYYYYGRPEYVYDDSLVAEVQSRLADGGYYHGAIDGIAGPRARSAIRNYERNHDLRVNGVIDDPLLADLGLR